MYGTSSLSSAVLRMYNAPRSTLSQPSRAPRDSSTTTTTSSSSKFSFLGFLASAFWADSRKSFGFNRCMFAEI